MRKIFVYSCLAFSLFSCNNEFVSNENEKLQSLDKSIYTKSNKFELNSKERMRNAILELIELQKNINNNLDARKELSLLLKNKYYVDHYVGLIDILYPNESKSLYEKSNIPKNLIGKYSEAFFNEINKERESYSNLKYIVNKKKNLISTNKNSDFDLNYYDIATIQFYAPYIEDMNDIEFDDESNATYVPGVIDSDFGLGYKNINNEWSEITIDDNYANNNRTIIIEPATFNPCGAVQPVMSIEPVEENNQNSNCYTYTGTTSTTNPNYNPNPQYPPTYYPDCDRLSNQSSNGWIREVKWGHGKLKHQYDKLISFTGNGGGSELMLCRKGSKDYLVIDSTGNFNNSQWDVLKEVYFSRKEIRKKTAKWLAINWDTNWECNTGLYEQVMCVWEADTEGNVTASGSVKWKKDDLLNFNYNIGNRSKDQLINHDKWDVNWFFATAFNDQGCGMAQGLGIYSDRMWPWRECGANFQYTMVYKAFYVGNNSNY